MKSEDMSYHSNKWLEYKQFVSKMQTRKLSCMSGGSEVVSRSVLDVKSKMKEMQQLEADIQQFITSETPIERFKRTFTFDVNTGRATVQAERFKMVTKTTLFGLFTFGCLKGFYEGREEFKQANKLTMFATRGAAHKRRSNHVMRCALRSGSLFAFKGGIFCCSVYGTYQCIEIYMNKTTPWSLTLAFGITGSLVKIGLGPKGMLSGFVIASVLGFIGGFVTSGALKLVGETQEELNYEHVKANFIARRRFQRKELHPVTEYHEEVDDIE